MALRTVIVLLHAALAVGIRLGSEAAPAASLATEECTPLESGAKVHLQSNLLENHFITYVEGTGDCGDVHAHGDRATPPEMGPGATVEMKHWTCSKFRLKEGTSHDSTFHIVSKKGGPIMSGDKVGLVMRKSLNGGKVHIDFSVEWPFIMSLQQKGSTFEIQKARSIDPSHGTAFGNVVGPVMMTQADSPVHKDTHAGEPICNGQDIFLQVDDETRSFQNLNLMDKTKPCGTGPACTHLYLQGNMDKFVGFPHHFPGFSGKPGTTVHGGPFENNAWHSDDAEASANKFTIVAA